MTFRGRAVHIGVKTKPTTPSPQPSTTTAEPEPTTTEVDTPEPSPEPTPPDPAQLINENTEEGAKSAAKYFLDLYGYVVSTLDLTAWEKQTSDDCEFCMNSTQKIIGLANEGNSLVGGQITIDEFLGAEEFISNIWELKAVIAQAPIKLLDQTGEVLEEEQPEKWTADIFLEFDNSKWILRDIGT